MAGESGRGRGGRAVSRPGKRGRGAGEGRLRKSLPSAVGYGRRGSAAEDARAAAGARCTHCGGTLQGRANGGKGGPGRGEGAQGGGAGDA